jgi:hypothetical protein
MNNQTIFQNVKTIITSGTSAICSLTLFFERVGTIGTTLADAGVTMAEANKEVVHISTAANKQRTLKELKEEFSDLDNFEEIFNEKKEDTE